jgi:hypothetical protein
MKSEIAARAFTGLMMSCACSVRNSRPPASAANSLAASSTTPGSSVMTPKLRL